MKGEVQIGDMVHYYLNSEGPYAALVTGLSEDGRVNLNVWLDGVTRYVRNVGRAGHFLDENQYWLQRSR